MAAQNYKRIESEYALSTLAHCQGQWSKWEKETLVIGVNGQPSFQHEWFLEPPEFFLPKTAHRLFVLKPTSKTGCSSFLMYRHQVARGGNKFGSSNCRILSIRN